MLEPLGVDRARVLVVLRPPPDVSLYHRQSNPLFPQTLDHLGRRDDVHAVVLPRTEEQRDFVRRLALPSVIVPERAVDAQSLIALADLVVSAGGTMNREAAALGVPVYTTYGGRLGGVDEALIRQGRLRPLTDPRALALDKRDRPRSRGSAATRRCCSTCCSRPTRGAAARVDDDAADPRRLAELLQHRSPLCVGGLGHDEARDPLVARQRREVGRRRRVAREVHVPDGGIARYDHGGPGRT